MTVISESLSIHSVHLTQHEKQCDKDSNSIPSSLSPFFSVNACNSASQATTHLRLHSQALTLNSARVSKGGRSSMGAEQVNVRRPSIPALACSPPLLLLPPFDILAALAPPHKLVVWLALTTTEASPCLFWLHAAHQPPQPPSSWIAWRHQPTSAAPGPWYAAEAGTV